MIKKEKILQLIEEHLLNTEKFLVDVKILPGNVIEVYIDSPTHVVISDCVALSRHIEGNLDREKEDFELSVSSPGATQPFKVLQQYKKYVGTKVKTQTLEGKKFEGILLKADDIGFEIEETRREKKPIGKGNHTVIEKINLTYNQVKETKSVLPF
ncbi:MAG: ribosome assembly cofactor RimP [Bacteroidia bacterium]|nr:ribosome assembly cofactor RimP [Bacteroidia bacterium]